MNLFHSARLKLTAFYFAILLVFCLILTFGVRAFTNLELHRGDDARRGAVHTLVQRLYAPRSEPPDDQFFVNAQRRQSNVTRQNLNRDFLLLDIVVLGAGAGVSYWYAGRTLRPIEAAHDAQKRFTADASHELRTPLATMRVENEVFLRQKHFSEPEAREVIGSNLEEVARLERLATNLLALNQYESINLTKQGHNITEIVGDAVGRMTHSSSAKHGDFTQEVTPARVVVERESLIELIVILLDNAIKYGPKGGVVAITGSAQGQYYVLQVRDRGLGIPASDLPYIFDRMYRGDKARSSKIGGHGIGLSLARQIASANGAQLHADNHSEGGAVFMLTLPQQ